MKAPIIPPPVASFPFLKRGRNLLTIWLNALEAQSNSWGDQWTKLKEGKYELKDWFSAVVSGTELTAATLEEMWLELTGDPSPPWHSLNWDSKDEDVLQLRIRLEPNEEVTVSKLSILGKEPDVRDKVLPELKATRIRGESNSIKLWLANAGNEEIHEGQYIGFVMRDSSPKPIAIVTVTRPEGV